ncbi:deleted in lung and esophageal cancer protein 1 [Rhincodon typus]|uniref:deleted in lung and esophageal cancer protein 1 n=1 Tax=Rhincodon typus TaxID=259920 RepID=UPI00202E6286|nr:deleted in lung and esophageal cancer protein 1 [Rhincodon typus]
MANDISFLLASIFKDLYTGDVIGKEIIKNLVTSRGGDDKYHEQFVQQLQEIHAEYDKRIAEADTVEKHIIQARARATVAEEKALNKGKESGIDQKSLDNNSLGLPTVKSTFRDCVDSELLKTHNLIVPEDYIVEKRTSSKTPILAAKPQIYVPKLTKTFKKRISKSPVDDGYTDLSQPKAPSGLLECNSSLTLLSSSEESIGSKISKPQKEKTNKYLWRDQLPVADRIQAREDMAKFEKCHNFLKSPRHLPPQEGGKSLIIPKRKVPKKVAGRHVFVDQSDPNEPIPVFLANPPIILFTNYKVGQVYETNVELRNLTSSSRHLRVIPPSTSFFSIGLGKFPGEGGIVAPGMSCQYTVRFAPDSPAEYEDFLIVETQTPYPLVVPIEARRSPPILSLPGTLDCGYCLVGGVKITEFLCRNDGYNSGCFCVMPKKMWPTTNFRVSVLKLLLNVYSSPYLAGSNPDHTLCKKVFVDITNLAGNRLSSLLTIQHLRVKEYHSVFYLVLQGVPEPLNANECSTTRKGSLERSMKTASAAITNIVGMELEVKGYTEPFQVLLKPYAILIPGENYLGTTLKKYFEMWNNSKSTIYFEWENVHDSHILEVLPPCGAIEPNDYCDLELLLTGGKMEKIKYRLQCHIRYQEEPVVLYVEAAFMGPQVCIDLPSLDFCLVRLGTSAMSTIQIKSTCQLSALWHLQESPECLKEQNEEVSQFTFEPSSGVLLPLAEHSVTVLFRPTKCQTLKTVLELKVENGSASYIAVKAEVQVVQVCLLSSAVIFKDVYIGIPAQETVKLFNQTLLPAKYTWGELHESEAHQCRVTVTPASYTLGPNEEITACVELTAYSMHELSGLMLSCMVEEMKEPLLLEILAKPKGLNVTYSLPADNNESNSLLLNFSEIMVHDTMKRQLLITNNTAISAQFNLEVEYFSSCSPVPPSVSKLTVSQSSNQSRTPLLKRTVNLTEGPSKSQNQLQREFEDILLCHRKGAAFVVQPKTGTLEPYQQLTVEITVFANMWGDYSDYLICRVGDLEPTYVPMQLSVKGIPLYFKILGPQKDNQMQGPVVRFGTHISGGDTVSRSLRLINTGPCDIRLDWETYNRVNDDLQLVDLIISYGQQFPLKDESGNEIMGTSIAPSESVHSYDWDAIPNSLESSSSALQTTECELEEEEEVPEGEQKESMPASPLISVVLQVHEGIAADYPYYVTPRQMVVPAGSFVTINVSFTPLTQTEVMTNVECEGFALGYLSLDDQMSFGVPGKVTRFQGYHKEALRLDFKAVVKPAFSLIQKEVLTTRGFKLTNPSETALYFQFLLQRPFCILNVDPKNSLKSSNSDREENTKMLLLYPQQHLHVTIAFCTSLDLLKCQENWCQRRKRKLEFNQDLVIEYSNKTTQLIPLHASFALPFLELSTDCIDFGICLVGQCRRREIFLLNRTGSKSFWTAAIAPIESQEEQGVFEICPEHGVLQAHSIHLSTSRVAIQITFKARDEKMYQTNVVIQGILGERPVKFSVQGRGTLDEKYEAMFIP